MTPADLEQLPDRELDALVATDLTKTTGGPEVNNEIEEIIARRLSEFARKFGEAIKKEWEEYPSDGLKVGDSPAIRRSSRRNQP